MSKVKVITIVVLSLFLGGLAHAKDDKDKSLPPGLQKKFQSGRSLPPGWQKKLRVGEILDEKIYEQGRVVAADSNKGFNTISVEGKVIRVIENTREIVEILTGFQHDK